MLIKLIFWTSFFFIFYTYAGYPLLLMLWGKLFTKKINKSYPKECPTVSVIIAAKNEDENIGPRLENLLTQNYPKDKVEIIIISDGSEDNTNAIVLQFANLQHENNYPVKLIALSNSKGKPNALNQGIKCAQGEIIVFTDSRQKFDCNVISELVANFSDLTIGCVSGELVFAKGPTSTIKAEMGLYWKIEKTVRKQESAIGSVVGATGAIYAIRKCLYKELPNETLLDDVLTPMNVVLQGYRTVFDSNACAYDTISQDVKQEWRRKVRTLAGNWQLFNIRPGLFSPRHNPIWWCFLSHKFFRLLVPFCLILLFASATLSEGSFYLLFTYLQVVFYTIATAGWLSYGLRTFRIINFSYFFMVLNFAAANGFIYWITGNCNKAWHSPPPAKGQKK